MVVRSNVRKVAKIVLTSRSHRTALQAFFIPNPNKEVGVVPLTTNASNYDDYDDLAEFNVSQLVQRNIF